MSSVTICAFRLIAGRVQMASTRHRFTTKELASQSRQLHRGTHCTVFTRITTAFQIWLPPPSPESDLGTAHGHGTNGTDGPLLVG